MADISVIKMPDNSSYNLKDAVARENIAALPTDVQINGSSIVNNGIANIPIATNSIVGVVKVDDTKGIYVNPTTSKIELEPAREDHIKAGTQAYKPITPATQYMSVFYGLAKAAGDTTQSASSNSVGTYTNTAATAIKTMLQVQEGLEVVKLI